MTPLAPLEVMTSKEQDETDFCVFCDRPIACSGIETDSGSGEFLCSERCAENWETCRNERLNEKANREFYGG